MFVAQLCYTVVARPFKNFISNMVLIINLITTIIVGVVLSYSSPMYWLQWFIVSFTLFTLGIQHI
jgi:hypothetical protein